MKYEHSKPKPLKQRNLTAKENLTSVLVTERPRLMNFNSDEGLNFKSPYNRG